LIPGLSLYLLDRMIRFYRGTAAVEVVSLKFGYAGHTRVELKLDNFRYKPGQYCFINIADISLFQWHPFSISCFSSESSTITFHIKDMGADTWTNKLAQIAVAPWANQALIRIDGPYGYPLDCTKFDVVILACGGIGVTPLHAILKYLYTRIKNQETKNLSTKKVYFIWSVRQLEVLYMFQETLGDIVLDNINNTFELSLIATQANPHNQVELPEMERPGVVLPFGKGRIDMDKKFAQIQQGNPNSSVACFSCGPPALIAETSALSLKYDFCFHEETFEL